LALEQLTQSKKVKSPSCHAMTKNVTTFSWWWWDSFSYNMMNQGDRSGDIVAVGVVVDYEVAEVLYL
jgi:hypothetical protein